MRSNVCELMLYNGFVRSVVSARLADDLPGESLARPRAGSFPQNHVHKIIPPHSKARPASCERALGALGLGSLVAVFFEDDFKLPVSVVGEVDVEVAVGADNFHFVAAEADEQVPSEGTVRPSQAVVGVIAPAHFLAGPWVVASRGGTQTA